MANSTNVAAAASVAPTVAAGAQPQRAARQIRGPQSALTDFLASHNINANQIRLDADARRAAALAAARQQEGSGGDSASSEPEAGPSTRRTRKNETKAQSAKRKKEEEKTIAKIKASKKFQRHRRLAGSDEDSVDENEAALAFFHESMAPLPGQMENCETCDKRFSVTAYSRAGPQGGLLCSDCTKEMDKEEGAARKRRRAAEGEKRQQRRKIQSQLLDGIYPGAKDLVTLCVETLAKNVSMADSFGDLPASLVTRLSAILSKKRLINSQTLDLFLRPGADTVTVYDGAKLTPDDYIRIFQIVPSLKHLKVRNGVQFKNKVMDHLLGTTVNLETFDIHGANLIDNERWDRFINEKGKALRGLKVHYTDGHFTDGQVQLITQVCPDLERLKISHNSKVTDKGIEHVATLSHLKHLSIEIYIPPGVKELSTAPFIKVVDTIGPNLVTLSVESVPDITDELLETIHKNCQNLSKLRLTDNKTMTDRGFTRLFTNWLNPPLVFVDLNKCRHLDATEPRENGGVGFCSEGFMALMQHSGETLKHLDVHSCRHISSQAFETVFAKEKTYPDLEWMDVSFCQAVNDYIVGCMYRSCPNLKLLKVFGNFGVKDVRVPKGKILVGVPNALGMQIEGTEDGEGRVI